MVVLKLHIPYLFQVINARFFAVPNLFTLMYNVSGQICWGSKLEMKLTVFNEILDYCVFNAKTDFPPVMLITSLNVCVL